VVICVCTCSICATIRYLTSILPISKLALFQSHSAATPTSKIIRSNDVFRQWHMSPIVPLGVQPNSYRGLFSDLAPGLWRRSSESRRGFESYCRAYCLLTRWSERVYKLVPGGYPRLLRSEYVKTYNAVHGTAPHAFMYSTIVERGYKKSFKLTYWP
jgi:hypothetical protein